MKTILLVDDEIICRLGIKALINWEEYGYRIIGEASNGEEALLFMAENAVDLVITDIRMPIVSGIEVITEVKKKYPNTKCVVLSSFDDFEFVREALKLGALDYILKLDLNKEVLEGMIQRIDAQVGCRIETGVESLQLFSDRKNKNYQRQLMRDLLYGRQVYSGLKDILKKYGFELEMQYVMVMEFQLGYDFSDEERCIVLPLLEEILVDYGISYVCMTTDNTMCVIYNTNIDSEEMRRKNVESLATRIIGVLQDYMNYYVTIYISDSSGDMDYIASLYLQVCQIKVMKDLHDERNRLFYQEVREIYDQQDVHIFDGYIKRLREIQVQNETDGVYEIMDEIYEYFRMDHYLNAREVKHFIAEISSIITWMCWKCTGKLVREFIGEKLEVVETVQGMQDVFVYMDKVLSVLEKIKLYGEDSYLVRKVKDYIDMNYDKKVQISEIADSMYVSNSYLSTLFKKETGETIKDYLIKTRVMHAKKLLKDSGMQIQEISRSVGCENEHYFSTMFKQRTGKSPKEYRNR